MPRYLYLLRHAQSAEKQHGQSDISRELTTIGMQQALRIAEFLINQKTSPDIIISSVAERAKATASLIADFIKYDRDRIYFEEELYEASPRTFFQFLSTLEDNLHHVMCVGHNPTISYLAEYLTKAHLGEMVPAGMAIIQLNNDSWKEISEANGELINYVHADMLKK